MLCRLIMALARDAGAFHRNAATVLTSSPERGVTASPQASAPLLPHPRDEDFFTGAVQCRHPGGSTQSGDGNGADHARRRKLMEV